MFYFVYNIGYNGGCCWKLSGSSSIEHDIIYNISMYKYAIEYIMDTG